MGRRAASVPGDSSSSTCALNSLPGPAAQGEVAAAATSSKEKSVHKHPSAPSHLPAHHCISQHNNSPLWSASCTVMYALPPRALECPHNCLAAWPLAWDAHNGHTVQVRLLHQVALQGDTRCRSWQTTLDASQPFQCVHRRRVHHHVLQPLVLDKDLVHGPCYDCVRHAYFELQTRIARCLGAGSSKLVVTCLQRGISSASCHRDVS
jgi:hypothetical protein